jgi:hypothetical protein
MRLHTTRDRFVIASCTSNLLLAHDCRYWVAAVHAVLVSDWKRQSHAVSPSSGPSMVLLCACVMLQVLEGFETPLLQTSGGIRA